MRYQTAVRHLRSLAEECERPNRIGDEPLLVGAYVFGDLLDGPDELERVQLAFVLNLPPEQVTWYADPSEGQWITDLLRLGKLPLEWYWRPQAWPAWNHYIRGPVRFWSLDGPDEQVLDALAERRLDGLPRQWPEPAAEREQLRAEVAAAYEHLRQVEQAYWEREWRRTHKGYGVYPEDHLWRAVHGYIELKAAVAYTNGSN